MKSRVSRQVLPVAVLALSSLLAFLGAGWKSARAQDASGQTQGADDPRRLPVFGKITTLNDRSIEITNVNGENVTIKLTDKTEYRKDRQPAKRSDFKVGDIILVRGQENADHSWTAQVIAARSMNGAAGPGRERGELQREVGTLGKDFVAGEIKSVDAPKLVVMRTDNVQQTMELNEDTSLRKGREAITMADIQPGDHLFARGGLENSVFVPKTVVIIGAEQWKRMQEWSGPAGPRRRGGGTPGPGSADAPPSAAKPPEPQH